MENVKIMVVESNHMVNSLVKDVMMFCVNRNVVTFFKDEDALKYMQNGDLPDLVITRFKDENVKGAKIVNYLKNKNKDAVFIFVSDLKSDKNVVPQYGANAFLPIPFSINDLFEIVNQFVVEEA